MHLKTNVTIEGNHWEIQHFYDETEVLKDCQDERNSGHEGKIGTGDGKLICRIPRHRFFSDFELQMYQKYKGRDDIEADMWLNRWMAKYPEFRTTTGGRRGIL